MERFPIPIKQLFAGNLPQKGKRKKAAATHSPRVKIVDLTPHHRFLAFIGVLIVAIGVLVFIQFVADAKTQFLPGTTAAGVPVGGLSVEEAADVLEKNIAAPNNHTVEFTTPEGTESVASSSAELGAHYAYKNVLGDGLTEQQSHFWPWFQKILFGGEDDSIDIPVSYNEEKLQFLIALLAQKANQLPHPPSVRLGFPGQRSSLMIDHGKDSFVVNESQTLQHFYANEHATSSETLKSQDNPKLAATAVLTPISQQLTTEQVERARERAEGLIGEQLVFERDHMKRTVNDAQLLLLLQLPEGYNLNAFDETLQEWAQELNRAPQDAEFEYDSKTLVVSHFSPDRMGLTLDLAAMKTHLKDGLRELEETETSALAGASVAKDLALTETSPERTLASTNDLGIKERIGFGESYYSHSIPTRIHNVSHTTNKINLTLIAPGEEFSFNKALGDVSAATGFQPAYIIKDGQTVLGDGGGVCQVSSTLFRALLDAGLQITRRLPHSYRVSYYELNSEPGFDATVYAGDVDLRFKNDTDHYVLVYGRADSSNLYMFIELYGTSDGRTTEISNYQSWDPRPPLPTEYVPDPSLAPGQLKQIDWAASGIRAKFTHTIRDKDGNVMSTKDYVSNYRAWAAKFLQGV